MKKNIPIDEILNSLDNIQKAEPAAFLHTRIKAKMALQQKETNDTAYWFGIQRPALVLAVLAVLLIANVYLITVPDASTNNQVSSDIASFAGSFNLSDSGYSY